MPELPDIVVCCEGLAARVVGAPLERVRVRSPFLLRTVDPPPSEFEGRRATGVRRVGKRVAVECEGPLFAVFHLMIAGRFRWGGPDAAEPPGGKSALGWIRFSTGTLSLVEASTKKRASLHLVRGADGLAALDPGGVEPLSADAAAFEAALVRENRTLKRALTDPRLFSGIGNAYSDEILHRARLSPLALSRSLDADRRKRLREGARSVLSEWTARLREQAGGTFPAKMTAFHPEMAVHGKYGGPCPACGAAIQRIVYAENEANYCATCQTEGRLLKDRALSKLLREDWPKTIEELEERRGS